MSIASDMEDFEYCGDCLVCNHPVDLSEMGNCGYCHQTFHWNECGSWFGAKHACNDCMESLGEINHE